MAAVSLPNVQVLYEGFAPVGGFVNGCGQAAVLMMNAVVKGQPTSTNDLLNAIKYSIATGKATQSGSHIGATTPAELQWLSEQQGVKTTLGAGSAWRSTVDNAIPQGKPVVLGVSNARAFGGSDSNVSGHYVTIVGTTTDGRYIVADPNQQAAKAGGTVVYSASQIQAAKPFATLTPVKGSERVTTVQAENGGCIHTIQFAGGPGGIGAFTICLDAGLDLAIRAALIGGGVLLIVIAILLFTRKTWEPLAGDAAREGLTAAAA